MFAFDIVELLLILLHFSDSVYIGIGTKNERQVEEVIYCFDCDVYDRKLEDEKFLYSKAIMHYVYLITMLYHMHKRR